MMSWPEITVQLAIIAWRSNSVCHERFNEVEHSSFRPSTGSLVCFVAAYWPYCVKVTDYS